MHLNIALSLNNLKYLCLIIHFISYTLNETVVCDYYFIFFSKIKYSSLFKTILCTRKPENPKLQISTGKLTYQSQGKNLCCFSFMAALVHSLPSK